MLTNGQSPTGRSQLAVRNWPFATGRSQLAVHNWPFTTGRSQGVSLIILSY